MKMPTLAKATLVAIVGLLLTAGCSRQSPAPTTPFGMGLAFGSSKDEVSYRRGEPVAVVEFIGDKPDRHQTVSLPEGRSIQSFDRWVYDDALTEVTVELDFHEGRLVGVWCRSGYGSAFGCAYRGLSSGHAGDMLSKSSEDDVRKEMGPPDHEEIVEGRKTMTYEREGVTFYLVRALVDAITVEER